MGLSGLTGSGLLTSKVERLFPDPGAFPGQQNSSLAQKDPEYQEATGLVFKESIS
jgi:hypothetical protein